MTLVARRYGGSEPKTGNTGVVEEREYFLCKIPDDFVSHRRFAKAKAMGLACSVVKRSGKPDSYEARYYILSKYVSARKFAEAVRGHWGIENSLHWQLDVTFGEDRCRIRKGHAAANFGALRRLAVGLLKQDKGTRLGLANKRLKAAWNHECLPKLLCGG